MSLKSLLFITLVSIQSVCFFSLQAQDAQFSQYYAASLYLNPAFSSAAKTLTIGVNQRNQWKSIVAPYTSTQISITNPIYTHGKQNTPKGAYGGTYYYDKTANGTLKTMGGSLNASYDLHLSSLHNILMGAQLGFVNKRLDFGQLTWGKQYTSIGFDANADPNVSIGKSSNTYVDAGAGVLYFFNPGREYRSTHSIPISGFAGASFYHINRPNESFIKSDTKSKLPMLTKIMGGIEREITNKFYVAPNALIQLQGSISQINLGTYINYDIKKIESPKEKIIEPTEVVIGLWYRVEDSFIFLAGIGNHHYTLGFSYDLNTSNLGQNMGGTGSYEISLVICPKKERKAKRYYGPNM